MEEKLNLFQVALEKRTLASFEIVLAQNKENKGETMPALEGVGTRDLVQSLNPKGLLKCKIKCSVKTAWIDSYPTLTLNRAV